MPAAAEKSASQKKTTGRRDTDAIYLIPEAFRYYPQLALAGPVLGFCNSDGQGLEGLELQYDNYLYGKPKKCMKMLDARGHIVVTGQKAGDPEVIARLLASDRFLASPHSGAATVDAAVRTGTATVRAILDHRELWQG